LLLAEWDKLNWQTKLDLWRRSFGAFTDALFLQPQRWEDEMIQDIRYAVRMLRKHKGFTFVAVMTLALGIGSNMALFTVFDALVLKPLPLKEPERLVSLRGSDQSGGRQMLFSYRDYLDYRERNTTLSGLVAWIKAAVVLGDAPVGRADDSIAGAKYLYGQLVSANYFEVLGARMAMGRGFLPEEEQAPGAHPVIVLSHSCWQQQFEGDPNIIGKAIRLQSRQFTVVGVTAREFNGTTPETQAFWVPLMMRDQVIPLGLSEQRNAWLTERDANSFLLLGRLQPGVTAQQAQAEFSTIAQQLAQQSPGTERKTRILTKSSASFINLEAGQMPFLAPLLLAFALVLLIACANVANLLLARAAQRQREFGVRLALGASRWRLIRQLLSESLLLASIGGLAGLLIASWALRVLYVALLAHLPEFPPSFNLNLDYRIFGVTLLATMIAGIAAGLAPALQSSRPDLNATLKGEGSALGQHLSQSRLRNGLIVTQIAVSLALLIGTGLLARSLLRAQQMDVGFDARNLLAVSINLNTAGAESEPELKELRRVLATRLQAFPGVKSVSQAFRQPSSGQLASTQISITGHATTDDHSMRANYNFVSPEHFATLSIPLVRGRNFTTQEVNANAPVVVISEATAQKFWPNRNPIGQHLGIAAANSSESGAVREALAANIFPSYEVIGVVRDTRSGWVWEKNETYLYLPLRADSRLNHYLMLSFEGDSQQAMTTVRRQAETIDPRLSVVVQRTSDHIDSSLMPFRLMAMLAGVLGAIALLLASIGLYGVTSFVVTQRTHEIGVRIALGAQGGAIRRLFLQEGMRLTVIGLAVGLVGGAGIARLLTTVLIDVHPLDPLTFVGVPIFLVLIVLLAIYLPARRATQVDPLIALRHD
ncbi:MAG TPA: ABC transporter permease, partial [Blastocatellia bacterium]|nr:ABC transporter permease [Blastocatellia bacterium]